MHHRQYEIRPPGREHMQLTKPLAETPDSVAISIVSHGQTGLLRTLLEDLDNRCRGLPLHLVVTLNKNEPLDGPLEGGHLPLTVVRNRVPVGFAANHNRAFEIVRTYDYFCALNPDVSLPTDPFPRLIERLKHKELGIIGPALKNPQGEIEASGRPVPTPQGILFKALCLGQDRHYELPHGLSYPDWIVGTFMLFPSQVFAELGGFDEKFFLYYEDVDICLRARFKGYQVGLDPGVHIVHEAQRKSRRHPKYLWWHLRSMTRFFLSPPFYAHVAGRSVTSRKSE